MTLAPGNTFDPRTHTYRIDGRAVPSVTQIVRGCCGGHDADPWYMERGTMVHEAVALMLRDDLDWDSLDSRIFGRVRAIQSFLTDHPCAVVSVERQLFDEERMYAGTADAVLKDANGPFIADWKGTIEPTAELQVAGYCAAFPEFIDRAVVVECRDDGTYRCAWGARKPRTKQVFDLGRAERVFLACLSLHGWKKQKGLVIG